MSNPILIKSFTCNPGVAGLTIVKLVGDGVIAQASAAADFSIGIADALGGDSGGRCEVILSGAAEVRAAGTIARGAFVTANANGAAVAASTGNRAIGMALEAAVTGDIIRVLIAPGIA